MMYIVVECDYCDSSCNRQKCQEQIPEQGRDRHFEQHKLTQIRKRSDSEKKQWNDGKAIMTKPLTCVVTSSADRVSKKRQRSAVSLLLLSCFVLTIVQLYLNLRSII